MYKFKMLLNNNSPLAQLTQKLLAQLAPLPQFGALLSYLLFTLTFIVLSILTSPIPTLPHLITWVWSSTMCLINRWEMRGVFEKPLLLFSVLGHVSQKQLWSQVPEFNKTCDPSWFWETHPCLVRLKKLHFSLKIKTKEVLSLTYTHTLCVTRSKFYTDVNLVTICGRNANTYCSSDRRGL